MKIRPVGAESFHAHGRTDRHDEANSCFFFLHFATATTDAWSYTSLAPYVLIA